MVNDAEARPSQEASQFTRPKQHCVVVVRTVADDPAGHGVVRIVFEYEHFAAAISVPVIDARGEAPCRYGMLRPIPQPNSRSFDTGRDVCSATMFTL